MTVLLSRVGLGIYWICDNIQILSQLKLISNNAEYWGKKAMLFWTISLWFNLIQSVRTYFQAQSQLNYYREFIGNDTERKEKFREQIKKSKDEKFDALLNIIKAIGDLFPSSKGAGLADGKAFSWVNDTTCGLGGAVSAAIFLYQTYK